MADREWFAALYQSCYRRLVLAAYALTNDLGEAEEIAQEAFALAYGRRARVAATDHPEAWIRTVAVNLARRRGRRKAMLDRILRRDPVRQHRVEPAGEHVDLHKAIRALGEDHRAVVVLHYLADLPVDEIASILDIPIGTVKSRLSRARAALAAALGTLEESVRQPELDSVVARHRQRTTRRRTKLAAAAAVLVVAAAIPVLRIQPEPEPIAEPPATGTGAPGSVAPQVDDVQFADEKTGYALRRVCDITKCDIDLLVTEDAQRWHTRDLPLVDRSEGTGNSMRLYVFAPGRIAVAVRGASSLPRWYSDDGGKTWRRVPDEFAPTVEAIPDGAVLRSRCIGDVCRHIAGVEVVLPDSGRSALLATQPPLNEPRPGDIPAGDGAWWVSGKDRATGRSALAVSRDAGRIWTVAVLQAPTLSTLSVVSVSASRDTMYATAIGEFSRTELGVLAIFASTDGGRTWSQTWYGATDKEPGVVNGVAIAKEKGSLLVVTEEGVHHSNDYGKTFELAKTHLGPVRWTRIGYLVRNLRTDNEYIRFADNPTWTRINVG